MECDGIEDLIEKISLHGIGQPFTAGVTKDGFAVMFPTAAISTFCREATENIHRITVLERRYLRRHGMEIIPRFAGDTKLTINKSVQRRNLTSEHDAPTINFRTLKSYISEVNYYGLQKVR